MINIIGLGYIGLPTALMFAQSGVQVVGTDINEELVQELNHGIMRIDEEGMDELFKNAVEKNIVFTTDYVKTDTYIITVPTPYNKETKKINVEYVLSALSSILTVCEDRTTIIVESTISPGTIDKYIKPLIEKFTNNTNKIINLAHAPERIIPGNMVYELKYNSRTIGAENQETAELVKNLYANFCEGEIITTDIKTAEMSKVVENTYRDINIAFANELAKLCHEDNMDVYEIIKIANMHPRVNILQPGPGVGGHCIPVDPWFLVGDYPEHTDLIRTAREVNSSMPHYLFNRIKQIMKTEGIEDYSKVGVYGLTYKENIDDLRESPTLQLIEIMKKNGISNIKVYDPFIKESIISNQSFDFDEFLTELKLVVIMVAHDEIMRHVDKIENKLILDTKNILKNKFYKL